MPTGHIDLRVRGAHDLAALARRLREAGNRELRLELLRGIRAAARPVPAAVRASARKTLPRRGGLAALVASSKISVRNRTSGTAVGVRVTGSSRHDIKAMDLGIVRKPLFGNKKHWYEQPVQWGWWTTPARETGEAARPEIIAVIQRIKRKIEG